MQKKLLALLLGAALLCTSACSVSSSSSSTTESSVLASSSVASSEASSTTDAQPQEPTEEVMSEDPAITAWKGAMGTKTMEAIPKDKLKVGFCYIGDIGDMGYSFAHDQGRRKMMKEIGLNDDQVIVLENVSENSDCTAALRNLVDQGCNMIFTTSFGHMDWTAEAAREFPNVIFEHCSGFTTGENMSAYFGRMYQMRYVSGISAGMKTASNKIGYVAAMPTAEVVRGANAFALGVKSVNPDATVEVKFTGTWYDPAIEKQVALELLNNGCDVIGQHCDTTAPQVAAQEKGSFAVGYNAATYDAAPKAYLTSPLWDWGVYYTAEVKKAIDGTWKSQNYWGAMEDGIVLLDALSPNCAEGTKEKVEAATADLKSGKLQVFAGPLKDNEGTERVAAGKVMTDAEMLAFDWFVDNVVGSVPKS